MKKIIKIGKKIFLFLLSAIALIVIVLLIIGVPKPPAISKKNVPRLSLSYLKNIYELKNQSEDINRFLGWKKSEKKMYLQMVHNFQMRYFTLSGPGEEPKLIEGLPESAEIRAINPNQEKHELIYALDNEGNEHWQLYRFDLDTQKSTLITNGKDNHLAVRYNPEGDRIIYTSNRRNINYHDHYVMDPEIPGSEKLVRENNEKFYYIDNWSPDGKQVVVRKYVAKTEKVPYILNIDTGDFINIISDTIATKADYNGFAWLKNGRTLFYPSTGNSEFMRLHKYQVDTGKDTIISQNIPWDIMNVSSSPDNNWLVFTVNEDGANKLYIHNLITNQIEKFEKLPIGNIPYASFYPLENSTIGFNFITPSGSMDIYSYNLESKELTKWFDTKKKNDYPDPQVIHYPTFDFDSLTGKIREITAYYHQPQSNIQKPYPVIINIHGGPAIQVGPDRDFQDVIDLNRGFAVLKPNVRGSTGYGKTFTDLDNGRLRENSVKDIGGLLDWISNQPDLDANKVFVKGGSYGGYMALASAVHYSDRIKGAIDLVGISNFVAMLEAEDGLTSSEFGDYKDPKMRAFLDSISPSNNVDKIKVPLLIVQGENDPRVPVDQSRLMVNQLEKNGSNMWYIEASNEGHSPKHPWNLVYVKCAEFAFIDKLMEN